MMIDLLQITGATECLFIPENKECTREDGIMAIAENRHARARPQLDRLARVASYFSESRPDLAFCMDGYTFPCRPTRERRGLDKFLDNGHAR